VDGATSASCAEGVRWNDPPERGSQWIFSVHNLLQLSNFDVL